MKRILSTALMTLALLGMVSVAKAKVDVTDQYVLNADLSINPKVEGNGWELINNYYEQWHVGRSEQHLNIIEFYSGWEGLTITEYGMKQTISLPAGDYRLAVNAFYRQGEYGNGTNNDFAFIFAGEKRQKVYALGNQSELQVYNNTGYIDNQSALGLAANAFYLGKYSNEFDFSLDTDGDIEIGFEGTFNEYRSWVILGPVKLYRFDLQDYKESYAEKVAEAQALLGEKMTAAAHAALEAAIQNPSTFTTSQQAIEATQQLNEAIAEARESISAYQVISDVLDMFEWNGMDVTAIRNMYDSGTLESVEEVYPMVQQAAIAGLGTDPDTDYTPAIINPSFEFGNTTGWTYEPSNDSGVKQVSNAIYFIDNADGDYLFNTWASGNAISQTIEGLPNGLYMMSALIATDAGNQVKLFANDEETIVDAAPDGKDHGVRGEVLVTVTDGSLTIGAMGGTEWEDENGIHPIWYKVDDFHLTYKSNANASNNWTDIILNGDMEGTDNRCFYTKNAGDGDAILSTIVNGIGKNGSRGVMVQSADRNQVYGDDGNVYWSGTDWDAQFWIRLPQVVPAGTPIRVSFDYRATNEGSVSTQCHQEPGAYIHWACIGSPTFTSNWQTWKYEGTVPSECDGKNFHSIAFNLSNNHIATKFYFDNIKVEIPAEAVTDFDFPEIVEPDPSPIITFADANVKAICVQNWDTNGDGELSEQEAAAVTDLGRVFTGNNTIKSFDELQYFTGLTFIENYAFDHCSGLNSITIPNSVKNIYCEAFRSCSSLISITIPKSVVNICNNAFRNCSHLTSIKVESGNTVYDSRNNCNAIINTNTNELKAGCVNTIIPNSVMSIGPGAFEGCIGLTDITIPNAVVSIGEFAFNGCRGLTSFTFPSSVISIGLAAFQNCSAISLVKVTITDFSAFCENKVVGLINSNIGKTVQLINEEGAEIKEFVVPEGVTSIGSSAFRNCTGLTSITIPNSVTSIGAYAFSSCSGLTEVHSLIEVPFAINDNVFSTYDIPLYVPSGTKVMYQNTDGWKNFNSIIEPIENITFADTEVKRICVQNWDTNGDGELSKDEAAAVTDLGEVFKSNTKIKKFVELQNFIGLNAIGQYAFSNCTNLSSITLPNTVTAIGRNAFATCGKLKSFTMPQSLKSIGIEAFAYTGLTSVTIPSSVTAISAGAFAGCVSLKKLTVKSGNTVYNSNGSCNAIIKSATNELIQGCQSTVIPNTVFSIGKKAFMALETLTSIDIPSSVTTIGERAFEGTGLISITIPSSVNSIGKYAFYNCTGLMEVHSLIEEPFAINDNTFNTYTSTTLYVPAGKKSKYKATAGWKNFTNIVEEGSPEIIYGDLVLRVWKTNGQILTINLADEPRTTYSDGNLVITTNRGTVVLPLEKVKRYTYEIVENVVTDIDETKTMRAEFSSDGETLTLAGLKPNTVIYLYNLAGQLLRTINSGDQSKVAVSISHLPMGVYIVKANDVTYKITKR